MVTLNIKVGSKVESQVYAAWLVYDACIVPTDNARYSRSTRRTSG
jgi:hypothetical protein